MSYTDLAFVVSMLPAGISIDDETKPTASDVGVMITTTGQSVTFALKQGGATVPVVDTDALGRYKLEQTKHVVWLVMAARGVESKDQYWENWGEEFWKEFLELLATPGAAAAAEAESGEPWAYTMHDDEGGTDASRQPAIKRGQVY